MRKKKHNKPVLPIYLFGLVWLLYSILFSLSGFWSFIKCTCLALIVFGIASASAGKQKKQQPASSKTQSGSSTVHAVKDRRKECNSEDRSSAAKSEPAQPRKPVDEVVQQGRNYVARIKELNDEIPDYKISAQLKQIEILTASIIDQVEEKKDKQKEIRQFINYYLPTTIKLLEQYVQLQNVGLQGENISAGMERIENMLDNVIVAFQKQLDSLFERDIVDITADIRVMEQMMEAEGLTNRRDF